MSARWGALFSSRAPAHLHDLTSSCVFQAVEELLTDLDLDKKSVVVGDSRVRPPANLSI